MSVRVCIAGAAGRMGQRLVALAHEDPELELAGGMEHPEHDWIGKDLGAVSGLGDLGVKVTAEVPADAPFDVIIDFTLPEPTVAIAEAAAEQGKALVIGTTGLDDAQKAKLDACSERVPLIHAPNCSVGVNVLFKTAALVAKTLGPEYEVEIVEAHHNQKVDAPSGTALRLAERIAEAVDKDLDKEAVYGRQGHTGKRPKAQIGVHALRMADVVGEHTAYFAIGGERIELTHRASSRDTFVRGALRAAKWLVKEAKSPGAYTMAQVLGFDD